MVSGAFHMMATGAMMTATGPGGPYGYTAMPGPIPGMFSTETKHYPSEEYKESSRADLLEDLSLRFMTRARATINQWSLQYVPEVRVFRGGQQISEDDENGWSEGAIYELNVADVIGKTDPVGKIVAALRTKIGARADSVDDEVVRAAVDAARMEAMKMCAALMSDTVMDVLPEKDIAEAVEAARVFQVMSK